MKRRNLVTLILGLGIPAVVGLIQIYQWIAPDKPRVLVLEETLPATKTLRPETRDFLHMVDMLRWNAQNIFAPKSNSPDYLSQMRDVIKAALPNPIRDRFNRDVIASGTKVLEVGPDPSVIGSSLIYDQILHLRLLNVGTASAKDVVIVVPSPGFFELWPDSLTSGPPTKEGRTFGEINVGTLAPGAEHDISFWPETAFTDDVPICRGRHADGKIEVRGMGIERNEDEFLLRINRKVYFGVIGALVAFLLLEAAPLIRWLSARYSRKTRPSGTPISTVAPKP